MQEIRHDNMVSTTHTQEAYNKIYRTHGILHRDSFYLWLISLLKPEPGKTLLDIACGEGRLAVLAQEQGLQGLGTDFAIEGLKFGQRQSPASGWVVGDGERLPLADASVDYVTNIGSLEHYQDPDAGMREIARVLKPSGTACILLPNSYGLLGNILYVLKTGDIFDDGQPLQRYNTPRGWGDMLQANGLATFQLVKYEREWPRTGADLGWYLTHPKKLARLFVSSLIPVNLSNFLVYLCRRSH